MAGRCPVRRLAPPGTGHHPGLPPRTPHPHRSRPSSASPDSAQPSTAQRQTGAQNQSESPPRHVPIMTNARTNRLGLCRKCTGRVTRPKWSVPTTGTPHRPTLVVAHPTRHRMAFRRHLVNLPLTPQGHQLLLVSLGGHPPPRCCAACRLIPRASPICCQVQPLFLASRIRFPRAASASRIRPAASWTRSSSSM